MILITTNMTLSTFWPLNYTALLPAVDLGL